MKDLQVAWASAVKALRELSQVADGMEACSEQSRARDALAALGEPTDDCGGECPYCGGNCPSEPEDSENLCDGFKDAGRSPDQIWMAYGGLLYD